VTESSEQPLRGDIWLASLGAGRRGELGKNRPAIVISADWVFNVDNDDLIVIVPLSTSRTPSPLRPSLGPDSGIDHSSAAICRAVRGVARSRLLRRLGQVTPEELAEIEQAVEVVLALDYRD
jgi:mRNA interferase MazF